jgi:hypothetical protein
VRYHTVTVTVNVITLITIEHTLNVLKVKQVCRNNENMFWDKEGGCSEWLLCSYGLHVQ